MPRHQVEDPRYVLCVGGDADHVERLGTFFRSRGIESSAAATVEEGGVLLSGTSFDIVVLDTSHEHRAAMAVLFDWASLPGTAVIVVSEFTSVHDRIQGLERGADDYLGKPFEPHELLARMRAVYRRSRRALESRTWRQRLVVFGGWWLDVHTRRASHEGGRIAELTGGEFTLLKVMLDHAGEVLTRERLAALTHRDPAEVFHRSIDVLVGRLRRKLTFGKGVPSPIETVRGQGYRIACPVQWSETPGSGAAFRHRPAGWSGAPRLAGDGAPRSIDDAGYP